MFFVLGAMAELPFGSNPFSTPAPAEASDPRPTASYLARQTIPPTAAPGHKTGKSTKRKEMRLKLMLP